MADRLGGIAARLRPLAVAEARPHLHHRHVGHGARFDAQSGGQYWASQTPNDRGNETSLYGGGIAYDNGVIYATNGLGYVSKLDVRSGGIVWKVRPGGPLRGAPTVANDAVYAMSQDNQIYSLKESDGSTNWSQAASLEIAGVFGTASPAIGQGTVVAGFSSGELNAYRYENGRQVWQDALQRTSITTSVSTLSDIDADPVIDNGQVFALGQGGRMVALELNTGQRMWELNIAGISTPWLAGDWLFVVTDDSKLICVQRSNGHIRWINQLPAFEKAKAKKGQIDYSGPGARRRTADRGRLQRRAHLHRSGDRFVPEPDHRRRADQPAARRRQFDALHLRRRRPAERLQVGTPKRAGRCYPRLHASSHRRDRRPAQRRQIDAVQPARRQAPGAGRRPARSHARPPRRRRRACSGSSSG